MAKPRVFISSTFYDLRHVRAEIDRFLETLGYEPIRNEEGDISYGNQEELENYCYREIQHADILISIIGGRYGSESGNNNSYSISQQELKTALKENKQVYIFIEKNVLSEYNTYLLNKENKNIKYKYVDNTKIYSFIEEIKKLQKNNNIKDFESVNDITKYLKEQFAGLFQRFLEKQASLNEINLISKLESASQILDRLVAFLSNDNKSKQTEINNILMINHPLIRFLKEKINIQYNFYIEGLEDLKILLSNRGFKLSNEVEVRDGVTYYKFTKTSFVRKEYNILLISTDIFDEQKKLKFIKENDWKKKDNAIYETISMNQNLIVDDDIPF